MFKSSPIIIRLSLGFAAMLLMGCLLGAAALYNMKTLADLSDNMYRHPLTVINNVHGIRAGILTIRYEMSRMVMADSRAEVDEIRQRIEDHETRLNNNLAVVREQYLGYPEDVYVIQKLLVSWARERADIVQMILNGKRNEAQMRLTEIRKSQAEQLEEQISRIQNFAVNRAAQFNYQAGQTWRAVSSLMVALMAGLLLIGGMGAWWVTRGIVNPLESLRLAMIRLAKGDMATEVPLTGQINEMGEMARAVEVFKQEGIKAEAVRWVRGNVAELSTAMRKAESLQELAQHLIRHLVPLMGGMYGVFYAFSVERNRLEPAGHYVVSGAAAMGEGCRPGEGLVEQCAQEKHPILLSDIPPGQFKIRLALGELTPATVIAAPVVWKDDILAVIEMGSLHPFSEAQLALLDALMAAIGLNLEVLNRSLRTQQLLEQTQQQAEELRTSEEELQTQSEELREANTLLQQKADALRTSEEELNAQSEEIRYAYDELVEKTKILMEREDALDQARKDAEQRALELDMASRYKSEFLANMSHELRTPLNSMLILAQDLAANESANLSADQVESAQVIHQSGSHLLSLINDILDISKIEAGKVEVYLENVALAELASSLDKRFRPLAEGKGIGFSVRLADDLPPTIATDRRKIDQIINNLLGNALKFTEKDGVDIAFSRADGAAPMLQVVVHDSGVGIPAVKLGKIFDAFEQADGSTSRRFGGTGLGLAISRKLAQLLGGDIAVVSEEGQGSTFTLMLPLTVAIAPVVCEGVDGLAPKVAAPSAETVSPPLSAEGCGAVCCDGKPSDGQTLLLVEDDPNFSKIVCDLARKKGFRCMSVKDGESGVALASRYHPTGIILDVGLPGQDGWAVMEQLKRDPATSKIPVHFISAFDESLRGLGMGAVGYLVKPVTKQQIESAFVKIGLRPDALPRRVLVLDADAGGRKAAAELIRTEGREVVEAENGQAALDYLARETVGCVILATGLPDMNELDFLEKYAVAAKENMAPVVICSDREISADETLKYRAYTDSIVIKGGRSQERLLDEVSLFLHQVHAKTSKGPAAISMSAANGQGDEILAGRQVLVVDDDLRNTFALSKVLRGRGMKVLMAQDGDKALAQLEANPSLEIVLMDIMMPGKDGYQTMRELRKNPAWRDLPVIALTAKAMPGDREKCLEAGANDYLTKPVDIDKLLSMMRVWLQN